MRKIFNLQLLMILCIVILGLCCVSLIWDARFFGKETTIIGGILLALNAYFTYKWAKEQNRSNNLVAKGQLDTRFKDAVALLAEGETSAELSAIHALNQIAIDASKTKDQQDYVKVIKDILISFIQESSVIKYKEEGNKKQIVENAYSTKSKIVLQTIINKMFKEDNREIYTKYSTDLSDTVLKGINFSNAQLQDAKFKNAQLQNAYFYEAQLQNAEFNNAQLQYAGFSKAQLQYANFANALLHNAYFFETQLQNVRFSKTQLQKAYFFETQLQNVRFFNAHLQNVDFSRSCNIDKATFENTSWNKKTKFKDTAFENKTIEELTEIMGNPPTPLE